MDNGNDNAEALRAALSARAECGWGCYCDACWSQAARDEERLRRDAMGDPLGAELALYDALWRLTFGDDGGAAQAVQEARSHLERPVRSDDL